jgi:hypothetical protein
VIEQWYAWTFAAALALALLAAGAALVIGSGRLHRLPLEHAAAAALLAVPAWEILIDLPGSFSQFFIINAGIANPPLAPLQVFLIAQTVFVLASAVAVVGVLRRWVWAAVLGVGMGLARVTLSGLAMASLLTLGADSMPEGQLGGFVLTSALLALPSVAAIVLLVLPFLRARRSSARERVDADGGVGSAPDSIATSS